MSFYITLSSNANRDVYPHNQGGNFTVELNNSFTLHGYWEAALVELWYNGQHFPNISQDNSAVRVRAKAYQEFKNDYVLFYTDVEDMYIKVDGELRPAGLFSRKGESRSYGLITFTPQHYNIFSFEKEVTLACIRWFSNNFKTPNEYISMYFKDNELKFDVKIEQHRKIKFTFSPSFVKYLGLTESEVLIDSSLIEGDYQETKKLKTITPPIKHDDSILLITPATKGVHYLKINSKTLFEFTGGFWTLNTLKLLIDDKLLKFTEPKCKIEFEHHSEGTNVKYIFENGCTGLEWSPSLAKIFGYQIILPNVDPALCYLKVEAPPIDKTWLYETFNLPLLYYETVPLLLADLNMYLLKSCTDILTRRGDKNVLANTHPSFSLKSTVEFTNKSDIEVQLRPFLLNSLGLSSNDGWLHHTQRGSRSPYLRLEVEPYFYVHVDCITGHYVDSDETNLIKIVSNNARINAKMYESFNPPQYFPVCKHFLNCINVRLTNASDEDLKFNSDVSCTLHFKLVGS